MFCCMILISEISSQIKLKTTDICIRVDECQKKSIECGHHHCSVNASKCQQFKYLSTMVSFLKDEAVQQMTAKYQYLLASIKPCTPEAFKFKPSDICVRKKECFERKRVPLRTGLSFYLKKAECPCEKENKFECGSFCTLNRNACNYLESAENSTFSLSYC